MFNKLTTLTTEQLYDLYLQHALVETDTRKLQEGDIFFALSGPNFNGNEFALKALEAGAAYAVVDAELANTDGRILKVDNVLDTLQLLAKLHREQFEIPFIAITGSNGKTTTKELVNAVLSAHYTTYTTQGNLNNHIGIPLTMLRVKKDAEIAVIEMGANHQYEIAGYCNYVEPTHAIITNCGKAHLEGFGGIEGVRKGKGELFDYIRANNGTAFIFNDYEYLIEMSKGIDCIISYGTNGAEIRGKTIPSEQFLQVEILNGELPETIKTQLVGDYNLPNVLCAVAVGKYFKVPMEKIKSAIEAYVPGNSRSQMIVKGTNHVILDAYNANPTSMKVAIENIAKIDADKKILMLGGMMELGNESEEEHIGLINLISRYKWNKVVLVGGDFGKVKHPFDYFNTSAEAALWAKQQRFDNTYFLIKGSRSIQMEKIAAEL